MAQKTVKIHRGQKGFGFTLAGQYPCFLNNVHNEGVAFKAGLRIGDKLMSIGGEDVSRLRHGDIVELLADQGNMLTLRVESADDYNQTESSVDSDSQVWRQNRQRSQSRIVSSTLKRRQVASHNDDKYSIPILSEWPLGSSSDHHRPVNYRSSAARLKRRTAHGSKTRKPPTGPSNQSASLRHLNKVGPANRERKPRKPNPIIRSTSEPDFAQPSVSLITHAASDSSDEHLPLSSCSSSSSESKLEEEPIFDNPDKVMLFEAVLVYIGAVPVPHLHLTRRHVIKCAVQSLRAQRATARTVQMQIFPDQIVVTNSRGSVTQRFATSSVVFFGSCQENKQFLGICTTVLDDSRTDSFDSSPDSTSDEVAICHVFAADPQLHLHSFHYYYAKKFGIKCSKDPDTGFCLEFPYISSPILYALTCACTSQRTAHQNALRAIRQTPTGRSANHNNRSQSAGYASGSDSGIGGRDSASELPNNWVSNDTRGYASGSSVGSYPGPIGVLKKSSKTSASNLRVTFEEPSTENLPQKMPVKHKDDTRLIKMQKISSDMLSQLASRISGSVNNLWSPEKRNGGHFRLISDNLMTPHYGVVCYWLDGSPFKRRDHDLTSICGEEPSMASCHKFSLLKQPPVVRVQRSLDEPGQTDYMDNIHNLLDLDQPRKLSASQPDLNSLSRKERNSKEDPMLSQNDIETALRNPKTRKPFEDFLDQQFCGENLRFWLAIEAYRIGQSADRPRSGRQIYDQHFSENCMEPVNVDSVTINTITQAVNNGDFGPTLFDSAQYQIFHLLKYDVWPRFLQWQAKYGFQPRSNTVSSTDSAQSGDIHSASSRSIDKTKEKQRKSLLSWKPKFSRKKKEAHLMSQSTEKEVIDESPKVSSVGTKRKQAWKTGKQHSVPSDFIHNVRPSTSSKPDVVPEAEPEVSHSPQPHSEQPTLSRSCTVILPSGQRLHIPVSHEMTVRQWVAGFAEEHGFNAMATEIYDNRTNLQIDPGKSAPSTLLNKEIRLESAVLFKLDLPAPCSNEQTFTRKLVAVRAKPESTAGLVLRPVLQKYGLDIDQVVVCFSGSSEVLPSSTPIQKADRRRLIVMSHKQFQDWVHSDNRFSSCPTSPVGTFMPPSCFSNDSPTIESDDFHDLSPSTPGLEIAELAEHATKTNRTQNKTDTGTSTTSGPLTGMLKFVRKSSHGQQEPTTSTLTTPLSSSAQPQQPAASGSLRRKSLGLIKTAIGAGKNGPVVRESGGTKRQSFANVQDFKEQMQKDKVLGDLWNRATSNRLDDQRGVVGSTFELPDFLKVSSSEACWDSNPLDLSGVVPSVEQAEALFSGQNVSVVRVDDEGNGKSKKASPHPTGAKGTLRCRPILYSSSIGSVQKSQQDNTPTSPGWQMDYV